jgi:hypothetical protein
MELKKTLELTLYAKVSLRLHVVGVLVGHPL